MGSLTTSWRPRLRYLNALACAALARAPLPQGYAARVPARDAILVLHGITMSGASMLRNLGPLRAALEGAGFELIAPNAGHRMSSDEVASIAEVIDGFYRKRGRRADEEFRDGRLWDAGEHYDWFASETDAATGTKTYRALTQSLDAVADAVRGKRVVGFPATATSF